jgi:hypothetical protein
VSLTELSTRLPARFSFFSLYNRVAAAIEGVRVPRTDLYRLRLGKSLESSPSIYSLIMSPYLRNLFCYDKY